MFELAESTFKPYAQKWGYDYRAAWYDNVTVEHWPGLLYGRRPLWRGHGERTSPCWLKIPAIAEALSQGYDFVLYVDHDAVVLDDSKDAENVLQRDFGMLNSFIGGPCIGFVLCWNTCITRKFWSDAWFTDAWETADWTDNGQVLSLLGYTTTAPAIWLKPTEYTPFFEVLPEAWGGVGAPYGGKPFPGTHIYHVAYHSDPAWKLAVMRDALERKRKGCL